MENEFLDVLCYLECAINMDCRDLIAVRNTKEDMIDKCLWEDDKFEYIHNDFADSIYEEIMSKENEFKDSYIYKDGIMCEFESGNIYIRAE